VASRVEYTSFEVDEREVWRSRRRREGEAKAHRDPDLRRRP